MSDNEIKSALASIVATKEENGYTWEDVARIMRETTGASGTESKWRKLYRKIEFDNFEELPTEEENKILEIKKKIVRDRDERSQTATYIRRLSREDSIKEIAHDFAEQMSAKKILEGAKLDLYGDKEAILQISDWHYGMECNNYWNAYNPDIAELRIDKLKKEAIDICLKNDVKKIRVVNLSDMIAGRIHSQIRIESRYDVITQTMRVSEILAEFLTSLSERFEVEYYDCSDNHSRIEPNKKDSLQLESLTRIIHWYLKERLADNERININENKFGDDIISFSILGHNVVGCHGDKDKPSTVVDNLTLMTHNHYDLCLTAHRHHFSSDEKNNTIVVSNGTLMGADSYSVDLRLTCTPSQNLIVVSENNVIYGIHRINVQ